MLKALAERLRRTGGLESVTCYDPAAEADPRAVGMTRDGVAAIWAAVERLYLSGLSPAVGLCVRRNGRVVIDRAIGFTSGRGPGDPPGEAAVPATPDSLYTIFSASKAVTAMVIHLLDERRKLHLDDAVAEYIPEFGCNGKQWITIRHVLTHRAGIPTVPGEQADLAILSEPDRALQLLCEARPVWRPGRRLAYHALTGGFVLGEVVRRVTGRTIREVLRDEILAPLGFRHMNYGVDPSELGLVARHYQTSGRVPFPLSALVRRALGVDFDEAVRLSNDPRFLTAVIPSGNIVATANEVSRFYQLLLDGGALDGVRIFSPRTIRRAISESSYLELDLTLGVPTRYGLGLMLGGRYVSPFGPGTPKAYGHIGFTTVFSYADPERETAVSLMTNGKPFLTPRLWRVIDVLRQIALHCPKA